jgi:hypothetical protein
VPGYYHPVPPGQKPFTHRSASRRSDPAFYCCDWHCSGNKWKRLHIRREWGKTIALACSMQRFLPIALILLSLTFLGQARVEPFSCGTAVAYSNVRESGCQKGCCNSSSCCKTARTKEDRPLHYNGDLTVSLDWIESSLSFSRMLLILPMPAGLVELPATGRYAPPVLATNCVRLI